MDIILPTASHNPDIRDNDRRELQDQIKWARHSLNQAMDSLPLIEGETNPEYVAQHAKWLSQLEAILSDMVKIGAAIK